MELLGDVKQWLSITVDKDDAQLTTLIERAVAMVERETLWYFREARPAIDVLDGSGDDILFIRQPSADDPPSVVVEVRTGINAWDTVPAADYELDDRRLFRSGVWTRGRRNYRATYNEGFLEIPGDVCQLILELVAMKWGGKSENTGFKSEKIGDYSYVRADLNMLDQWRIVENNWRRLRI